MKETLNLFFSKQLTCNERQGLFDLEFHLKRPIVFLFEKTIFILHLYNPGKLPDFLFFSDLLYK